jgi:uncharacterized membrane protein YoaK (UPF0700 family)
VRDHYETADGIQGWLYDVRLAIPIVVLVVASACLGFVRRSAWWTSLAIGAAIAWLIALAVLAARDSGELWVLIAVAATALVIGFALAWWIRRDRDRRLSSAA